MSNILQAISEVYPRGNLDNDEETKGEYTKHVANSIKVKGIHDKKQQEQFFIDDNVKNPNPPIGSLFRFSLSSIYIIKLSLFVKSF